MSCLTCGKRVPVLFNSLKEANNHCTECLKKYRKRFVAEQKRRRCKNMNRFGGSA